MNDKRAITAEDLYQIQWVNDPVVSPENGAVAYVLRKANDKHDGYHSHIRLLNADGTHDVPFTTGEQDTAPAWSKDGSHLAFLRRKEGVSQVWIMPAHGGEAHALTDYKYGVSTFKWSPDGSSLLIKSEAASELSSELDVEKNDTPHLPEEVIIDRMKFKSDGGGLWNGRRSHLFLFDLTNKESTQLTEGAYDVGSFAWSPDGLEIAFTTASSSDHYPDPDLRLTNDLFTLDLINKSKKQLTDGSLSIDFISYTPDGQSILMLADDLSHGFATLTRIYLISVNDCSYRVLFDDLDIQLGHSCVSDMRSGAGTPPQFSKDQKSVYVQISRNGSVHIGRFSLDGLEHQVMISGDREVYQFALTSEENLIFAAADPMQPGDLFTYNRNRGEESRLTRWNESLLDELQLSEPEEFTFETSDGWPIQGWIIKPIHFVEGSKVPAVLEIHGGPQAMYGHTFMQEFQLLAASGYAVFYTNPRGGHGYGQVHVNTVRGDYGGRDYQDLMEAVDYVLKTYSYIDESRLGVTGGSYGGFMTNWIVGHTDRFKAAVTQRSISNWISFYGISDIGYYFTEDQIWGNPWDHFEKLWKHSPLAYVNNIHTPLLILHGEQDLRCPIEQGEQLFIALKRLHKETQLIRFPEADHNLSRSGHPHLRVRRLRHIVRWFEEHIERSMDS